MIPALLIWLYKKYIGPALKNRQQSMALKNTGKRAALTLALLMSLALASAKERTAVYHIKHNGNLIGKMQLSEVSEGENLYLKLASQVKTRMVIGINVNTSDQSHFSNGRLQYSNVTRSVNGRERENKRTRWNNEVYQTQAGSKTGQIRNPINYNMMLLYCKEPVNIGQVYSDNFQQFLPIKKTGTHSYRVELPDGNYNDYHFRNGICTLVVVHHSFYTIRMELIDS